MIWISHINITKGTFGEFERLVCPENLASKEPFEIRWYRWWDHIDGVDTLEKETTYIELDENLSTIQHIHRYSDAIIYIIEWEGFVLSWNKHGYVAAWDVIDVPRKMPHGFFIPESKSLSFISIQIPAILQADGTRDFIVLKNTELREYEKQLLLNELVSKSPKNI